MNDNPINNRIKAYYQSKYPDPEKLASLISIGVDDAQTVKRVCRRIPKILSQFQRPVAWSAGILLAVVLTFQVAGNFRLEQDPISQRIANEIAMNHIKQLQVEYNNPDIGKLRTLMSKLDFQLIVPERIQRSGYQLMGARYCSIQGNIAAQVKLISPNGNIHTLYETRATDAFGHIQGTQKASGVDIDMWQERGLLIGLAR